MQTKKKKTNPMQIPKTISSKEQEENVDDRDTDEEWAAKKEGKTELPPPKWRTIDLGTIARPTMVTIPKLNWNAKELELRLNKKIPSKEQEEDATEKTQERSMGVRMEKLGKAPKPTWAGPSTTWPKKDKEPNKSE